MQFTATILAAFVAVAAADSTSYSVAPLPTGTALIPALNSLAAEMGIPVTLPTNLPTQAINQLESVASMFESELSSGPAAFPTIKSQIEALITGPALISLTTTINGGGATPAPSVSQASGAPAPSVAVGAAAPTGVAVGGVLAAAGVVAVALL